MKNRKYHLKKLGMSGNALNVDLRRSSSSRKKIRKILALIKEKAVHKSFLNLPT